MVLLKKVYKTKEFLEKFDIKIKTLNRENTEKIMKIIENAKAVSIINDFPEALFNISLLGDEELYYMFKRVISDEKYEEYLKEIGNYFYSLLIELGLNKLLISPYKLITQYTNKRVREIEYTIMYIDTIIKHIHKEPYMVVFLSTYIPSFNPHPNSAMRVFFYGDNIDKELEFINDVDLCYVAFNISKKELEEKTKILVSRLKDFTKAFLI